MKTQISRLLLCSIVGFSLTGCSFASFIPRATVSTTVPVDSVSKKTNTQSFFEILQSHAESVIPGTVIAKLPQGYSPLSTLRHYAFYTTDGNLVYIYDTPAFSTHVLIMNSSRKIVHAVSFTNFQLNHAVLNGRILYVNSEDSSVVKMNTVSSDYSKVPLQEMTDVESILKVKNLQVGEVPLLNLDGYLYTNKGTIFDSQKQDYVLHDQTPGSAYPHAEVGDGNFLYAMEPRADGSIRFTWYIAKSGSVTLGNSVIWRLDLPTGTPMDQLEYAISNKGDLSIFSIGAVENGQAVVKAFQIPLGTYRKQSSDAAE